MKQTGIVDRFEGDYVVEMCIRDRLSTTREKPMSRASRAPSSVWMVICVDACSAKSGACAWIRRARPRSWIISASAPASYKMCIRDRIIGLDAFHQRRLIQRAAVYHRSHVVCQLQREMCIRDSLCCNTAKPPRHLTRRLSQTEIMLPAPFPCG